MAVQVYLVLEYVDGQDLFDHICSHGHLHEAVCCNPTFFFKLPFQKLFECYKPLN